MLLRLVRLKRLPHATIGVLYVNGQPDYFTLEDPAREVPGQPVEQWKVPGQTAIPTGTYRVVMDYSQRFGREMPHILDVPGFSGIRIHPGNTYLDTAGCPLVGYAANLLSGHLSESRAAFYALADRLRAALKTEEVDIIVEGP